MKKSSIVLSLLLLSTSLYGEEDIFGYWLAPGSIILIENCNNYVCAKIETIFVEEGSDPKQVLDEQNKDKALRSRTVIGINVLSGFLINDISQRTFTDGRIYDPRRGRDFKANLFLKSNGNLSVEGCLAFICDKEDWRPLEVTINDDGTKEASLKTSSQNN